MYAATKTGVRVISEGLRMEVKPYNIRTTVLSPGALATELGGDKVNVYTATSALQDVHRVDAKPSLVARARSADPSWRRVLPCGESWTWWRGSRPRT